MQKISLNQWLIDGAVLTSYGLMVGLNAAANIVPINGLMTGEISDRFLNLFAPAPITFAIWGVIYFLLGIFVVYQMAVFHPRRRPLDQRQFNAVNAAFIASSLANSGWIVAWHYLEIGLSLVLISVVLVCLMYSVMTLKAMRLADGEKKWIQLVMQIYFGWITVATIANGTTYLVQLGWNRWGLSESIWMVLILLVGTLIGSVTAWTLKSFPYLGVLVWAYLGILLKHLAQAPGFNGLYVNVISTVSLALVVFLSVGLALVWPIFKYR